MTAQPLHDAASALGPSGGLAITRLRATHASRGGPAGASRVPVPVVITLLPCLRVPESPPDRPGDS